MSKDDAKRVAWDAAWKSATERKGRFFSSKKINGQNVWLESPNRDQIQKLVAWGANSVSSDLEESTVYLVSNSDPQPPAF